MALKVRYHCHFGLLTGYSRAAHDYLLALKRHSDVELDIVPFQGSGGALEPRYQELAFDGVNPAMAADIEIFHATPKALTEHPWPDNAQGVSVALTTWETSHLPDEYVAGLDRYGAVITPSVFSADGMDLETPLYVVPHGIDPGFWDRQRWVRPEQPYTFYNIGAWSARKNPIGLLKAYFSAFTREDDCQLVMMSGNADFNEVRSLIGRCGVPSEDLPSLLIPDRAALSEAELLQLHHDGDCFVSATRGEGFGLGAFEAAAVGNPVIMPSYGGQHQFLGSYDNWSRVSHQLTPAIPARGGIQVVHTNQGAQATERVQTTPGVSCRQLWAEPDLVELGIEMRTAYETRAMRSKTGSEDIFHTFGYKNIAALLSQTLEKIHTKGK